MKCYEIALAPCPELSPEQEPRDPRVRVFLEPRRVAGAPGSLMEWELLHDAESVGTLARVGRGWLADPGGGLREVALKLRRDQPLGAPIDPIAVEVKFRNEFQSHQRLIDRDPSQPAPGIVGLIEHRGDAGSQGPDELPPCVFCTQARHAIPLQRAGRPLWQGESRGFERRLRGDDPTEHWSLDYHLDQILEHSLGQDDSACGSCRIRGHGPEACRHHVALVNFHENQFLIFPRWSSSLQEELQQSNGEHPLKDPDKHLLTRLALASDISEGLDTLHRAGIWHHDVNPENICVQSVNDSLRAALIDLGLSFDAANESRPNADPSLWPRRLSYAAWECRRDAREEPIRLKSYWVSAQEATFELDQSDLNWLVHEPPLCAGDRLWASLSRAEPIEVLDVHRGGAEHRFRARESTLFRQGECADLEVERQRGPAADLFGLGMVLLAMILDHPQGRPIRRELERAQDVLATLPPIRGPEARWALGSALLAHPQAFSPPGRRFFRRRLDRYGPFALMATRALGLAFSLALRGPSETGVAMTDRGTGDASVALLSIRESIKSLHEAVRRGETGSVPSTKSVSRPRTSRVARASKASIAARANTTVVADWRAYLPYWRRPTWDGKPQKRLLERLDGRALPTQFVPTTHQSEIMQQLQAVRDAIQLVEEFLNDLIAFQLDRPRGLLGWMPWNWAARALPLELAQAFPAALSAAQQLRIAPDLARSWLSLRQGEFQTLRDAWIQKRSTWERVWMDSQDNQLILPYWTDKIRDASERWRLGWADRISALEEWLADLNRWWPPDPQRTRSARFTDADLEQAATGAGALLEKRLPWLSERLLGPAGDVEADWIWQLARGSDCTPTS
jgi:serine/threonine protein kinase